ncbi:phospholipid phosphatase-related protein type 5 [Lethenteron reissneri]|uniref:phospholipid phosphatase-related protein type 5 n=1 Tax=Lethenteron reissneri TaxID=7753 RepID=UPI002AB7303D|nr:phospholipid phosphatase-related protein type 5 [Lethenteron reissneri]
MLYVQLVLGAGTVLLAYHLECSDTFPVTQRGFFCWERALAAPDPGPEARGAAPPAILYPILAALPCATILVVELAQYVLETSAKHVVYEPPPEAPGDHCHVNALLRRIGKLAGLFLYGLLATDIFANVGQVVSGGLTPHFLSVCKPNYTALPCHAASVGVGGGGVFITDPAACTGSPELVARARLSFPCKEAAFSLYSAVYTVLYVTSTSKRWGIRLVKPTCCLGLMGLGLIVGLVRIGEHRNHWADVITGYTIGAGIATFLCCCVVGNFKRKRYTKPWKSKPAGFHGAKVSSRGSHHVHITNSFQNHPAGGFLSEVLEP